MCVCERVSGAADDASLDSRGPEVVCAQSGRLKHRRTAKSRLSQLRKGVANEVLTRPDGGETKGQQPWPSTSPSSHLGLLATTATYADACLRWLVDSAHFRLKRRTREDRREENMATNSTGDASQSSSWASCWPSFSRLPSLTPLSWSEDKASHTATLPSPPPAKLDSTGPSNRRRENQNNDSSQDKLRFPPVLPMLCIAGGVWLLVARRAQSKARLAALQADKDRASGEAMAWRSAFLQRNRHHPRSFDSTDRLADQNYALRARNDKNKGAVPFHDEDSRGNADFTPASNKQEKPVPQTAWSQFLKDINTAMAESQNKSTANQRDLGLKGSSDSSLASRDMFWEDGTAEPTDLGEPQEPQWQRLRNGKWVSSVERPAEGLDHSCSMSTRKQRWQTAFGPGSRAVSGMDDPDGAWAKQAEEKKRQADAQRLQHIDAEIAATTANTSNLATSVLDSRKQKSLRRRQGAHQPPHHQLERAILDELDAAFFDQHLKKDHALTCAQSTDSQDPHLSPEALATEKGQHVSMDNLFLEAQLEDAAQEGREARAERLRRQRDSDKRLAPTKARETHQEDQDPLEWLDQYVLKAALDARVDNSISSMLQCNNEIIESLFEEPSTTVKGSLLEASLEHAAQEGAAIRRREQERRGREQSATVTSTSDTSASHPRRAVVDAEDLHAFELDSDSHLIADNSTATNLKGSPSREQLLQKEVSDLSAQLETLRDQVGKMNVWADEVHRKVSLTSMPRSPSTDTLTDVHFAPASTARLPRPVPWFSRHSLDLEAPFQNKRFPWLDL